MIGVFLGTMEIKMNGIQSLLLEVTKLVTVIMIRTNIALCISPYGSTEEES